MSTMPSVLVEIDLGGTSMTAISLGQASQPASASITAAITVGRFSSYPAAPTHARERLKMRVGNITPQPHNFAGGFVDFLLGRRARHPR
jgi:hypothetical protein